LPNTSPVPPAGAEEVADYVELARRFEPAEARYLTNHRGHLVFVKPEERHVVTAALIRETIFTATEAAITDRLAALRDAGYSSCHARRPRSRLGPRDVRAPLTAATSAAPSPGLGRTVSCCSPRRRRCPWPGR
jgi:hypothetical protein